MAQPQVEDHNTPAVVTFMTTEHFVLQTVRSAAITERFHPPISRV